MCLLNKETEIKRERVFIVMRGSFSRHDERVKESGSRRGKTKTIVLMIFINLYTNFFSIPVRLVHLIHNIQEENAISANES